MDPFAPRDHAALDYWFWKFHIGDLAFLVDVIIRRRTGTSETRVSYWLRGTGRVLHEPAAAWSAGTTVISVGRTELRPGRSVGMAGDVRWDLQWLPGSTLVSPLRGLIARLEPFDTSMVVWPQARFTGIVQVGPERFDVQDVPGALTHYWGRRLLERWVWLSATQFDGQPQRRLEGIVGGRSRLFGRLSSPVPISILWTTDGLRDEEIASAVNGIIRARVTETGVTIDGRRLGGPRHRIVATWGEVPPNDLGEGIVQTLHADLSFDEISAIPGSVGLEVRGYPHPLRSGASATQRPAADG
jgi:hypothetical protein